MDGKKLEYKEILARNGKTEYLNKYMGGSKDVLEFKSCVPVIMYNRIRPYIQRIANGEDSSLITGYPITEMLCSSGTSAGEPKMMPSIAEDLDRRTFLYNLIMPIINQYVPGLDDGKAMFLYFVKAEMSTPCGLPARTVLTSYYKSKHFKCRSRDPYNDFTSPDQAILCNDSNQSMYCQLLAGLVHRHQVLRLGAVFASAFLRTISFLECKWVNLCTDIRTGQLDPTITDLGCRSAMLTVLSSPNPRLADEIEDICGRESWKGIVCYLWPRARYIEAVVTGSMAQYIPSLEYYSDGKLPLVCTMYASSECYFGVNLKPLCDPADVAFTLLPNMGYFEFIPLGENGTLVTDVDEEEEVAKDKLVNLVDVRLGCYYELVVTTFAGLYRYRIASTTTKQTKRTCTRASRKPKKLLEPHNALLVEYTSYAEASSVPGHYVIYWEIRNCTNATNNATATPLEAKVLQECCIAVEEELDYVYRRCRANDKSVGPLEIRVVKPGTFDALMDLYIDQGGSINQYKTPRCIKSDAALMLLDSKCQGFLL
ncbi:putative indole-3-acetic acid-amido synthetase GH3.9 [Actinidia rufa]|uniref:Putative indole-3-acetic acid-amido synthetase GH3.9 n=1 Tax=Actinidia rufa TaxID=165716 RepID=A0A7J0H9L4_9ERIC|nr:putative indole-3-acetic acid-amido synthetase GH3.9 [Actinidia rufa]